MVVDPALYKNIGQRVAELRKTKRVSQERFSELCGISASYVAHIEAGDRKPTLDVLGRIADALGVPLWRLLVDQLSEADDDWSAAARRLVEEARGLSSDEIDLLVSVARRFRGVLPQKKAPRRPAPKPRRRRS